MEIVIENPSSDSSSTKDSTIASPSPIQGFVSHPPQNRAYRAAYVTSESSLSPSVEYYGTLQPARPRSRLISPEPDFEAQVSTSVRRVDRSGLLEIADPEPQQRSSSSRACHQTGAENHSGTLTRRVDRSGLLEAVPELPDQIPGWRTPEKKISSSISERKLTGAELEKKMDDRDSRESSSPRRSPIDPRRSTETLEAQEIDPRSRISPTNLNANFNGNLTSSMSSPYLRRFPGGGSPNSNLERPTPILVTSASGNFNRNSFTCSTPSASKFLPIEALPPRARQSYVDLTGATYTRSSANSPITISSSNSVEAEKKPDCIGRSSPRSRNDRQSPLTMSAIPDVIEAHGSRSAMQRCADKEKGPEGQRAEAEGCEHTALENLEETRVSFKAPNKILHNDNIQTLRVIILSEQL